MECKYCGKEFKSLRSVHYHENRCPNNQNRKYKSAWNKGLTKETDERVKKYVDCCSEGYKSGRLKIWCDGLTKETDERLKLLSDKIKQSIKEKINTGNWHNSFSKSRTQIYKNVNMMGTWEVEFAKLLDKRNINWEYTKHQFDYLYNDEIHKYNPDFYLPEFDTYIEIKGYPTKRDIAKWTTSNIKNLNIFFGDDLIKLGMNLEVKDCYHNIDNKFRAKNLLLMNKLNGG